MPLVADNRKARFDYEILETLRAGIVLHGFEVKAIIAGRAALAGSFILIRGGEAFWVNSTIAPYQPKNTPPAYRPDRPRKLLLTKKELLHCAGIASQKGLTLVPLGLYTEGRKIKLEFAVCRSKRKFEKRETIRKKEFTRERQRILRQ